MLFPSAGDVALCCHQLAAHLPNQVVFPENSTYASIQHAYWSRQEASLSPSCIFAPHSASDVSVAVTLLYQSLQCPFAIKGGGHSPNAGFANIQNGITIDLAPLNSVSLNADSSVAHIGAGAKWLDVYQYLDNIGGVAVAGGENGDVGVGGLLLGGGLSLFGPRVGWACDTFVNVELVLASGHIVNANRTSHPGLWKALKGGGSNFGVITRYDLATFPQGQIWAGSLQNLISHRQQAFNAFVEIANGSTYDPYVSMATEFIFTGGQWRIEHALAYTKEVKSPPAVYQPIWEIPSQPGSKFSITNLSTFANKGSPPATLNIALQTGTYGVDAELLSEIFTINNATLHQLLPRVNGTVSWSIAYQPLPPIWMEHAARTGGNSLGTSPQHGSAFVVLLTAQWADSRASVSVQSALSKIQEQVDHCARSKGLKHDFVYMNYAGMKQNPFASYGKANLDALKKMARSYDPHGTFQTQMPGGFKLWGV